ncbi:MAG: restriction endonuclease subunit S [Fusobacterium sp.]
MKENTEWKDTEVGKIPIDWNIFKLKEKVDVIMGQSPSSNFYNKNKIGLPFMQGRTTFGDKHHTINMWTSEVKRIAIKDSVLMSVRAPVGDLNIAINELCIGRGLASLNMKNGNNEFLFYLLRAYRDQILNKETGTVFGSINKSGIENLELPFPPFLEQKKIAAILKSLDDKIELNNKMNETLEEMAQTIFKEWFVNFNFPNEEGKPYKDNGGKMIESELGMIPEGWRVGRLKELLSNIKETVKILELNSSDPYLPIDCIPMKSLGIQEYKNSEEAKSSLIRFRKNDILLGAMRVYFHRVSLAPFDGITRSTCFVLRPNNRKYLEFLTLSVFMEDTISYANSTSKGTTMPYATWENGLGDMKLVIPEEKVIESFKIATSGFLDKTRDNIFQQNVLVKTRDTLLPKLMNGEVKV